MSLINQAGAPAAINPTLRVRTFEVGGKEYSVAFDFNAIAEAESITKLNILTGVLDVAAANALQIRGLLYASLQPDNGHKYTLTEAGSIIQTALGQQMYWEVVAAIIGSLSDMRAPVESDSENADPNLQAQS